MRDQDGVFRQAEFLFHFSGQKPQNPFADVAQIVGPPGQQFVFHFGQSRRLFVNRLLPGKSGAAALIN